MRRPLFKPRRAKGVRTDLHSSRNYFYQFGEIRSISLLPGKGCGFVQFTSRQAAESAAEKTFSKLNIKNRCGDSSCSSWTGG